MVHLCICAGQGGEIEPGRHFYITLFGGTELKRPTLAKMLLKARERGEKVAPTVAYFITMFGGVDVMQPTLAEEFSDLQAALRSGELTLEEADRALSDGHGLLRTWKLTIFGGCDTASVPAEEEELDSLAMLKHAGLIPPGGEQTLMLGIGRGGAQRIGVVRNALRQSLA